VSGASNPSRPLSSAVYEGTVRHQRFHPVPHVFEQRIAQLYIDLAELEQLFRGRWLWSVNRRNLAEFRRSDYLGPAALPLDTAVRECVARSSGRRPRGPIRMLTHLRYAGYVFNPVTFYYCFAPDASQIECIVAEITNTPWQERHAYVLTAAAAERAGRVWHWAFDKAFHVSPFMPMDCRYDWSCTVPGEELKVHMEVSTAARRQFEATLVMRRRPLDALSLARVLWWYPLMTARVISTIHWQALRLWLKRAPVYTHPKTPSGAR